MTEGDIGLALMVGMAIVSGVYFHYRDRLFIRAIAKAALASTVGWAIIVVGVLKHMDPLIGVALFFVFFWSFLIAAAGGIPFWWHRTFGVPEATGSLPDERHNNRDA